MYEHQNKSTDSPQVSPWHMRAEVTIRRGTAVTSEIVQVPPNTTTTTDADGIRMICRWNTTETNSTPTTASSSPSSSGYGFQRGNILFTSTPPDRTSQRSSSGPYTLPRSGSSGNDDSISSRGRLPNISDSGYNSEQFSPNSYSSLPTRRASQQYNRRCKSTCSIVLSNTNVDGRKAYSDKTTTPEFSKSLFNDSTHHRQPNQHVFSRYRFSTVPEVCEDCAEGSASSAFTTHFCTRVAEKQMNKAVTAISKDAASQTTDIESGCSSSAVSKSGEIRRKSDTGSYQSDDQKKKQVSPLP